MPLNAYALVFLFAVASILVGWAAVRAVGRIGGPRTRLAILLPVAAAFVPASAKPSKSP